jgi:N-acetylated-alpha-linked acidic dipeptidase
MVDGSNCGLRVGHEVRRFLDQRRSAWTEGGKSGIPALPELGRLSSEGSGALLQDTGLEGACQLLGLGGPSGASRHGSCKLFVMILRRAVLALAAVLLVPPAIHSQQPPGILGFTSDGVNAERALERQFRAIPSPEKLREYMRAITQDPHHAGSPGSRKVAEYILAKFKSWGLDAAIEPTEALLPFPTDRVLELVAPERFVAALKEPPVEADEDSADAGQLPTFNAYSADGDVTADLVYVNYGIPEDYEQLRKLDIDVKGKIVLARYGRSWRGIKSKLALEHGAVGCIIYSDPRDDGYFQGDSYVEGAWRPEQGVQRGSVIDMPVHPGDPLTPGWGAEAGGRKLDRSQAETLLNIPVLPISYADALPLLRNLKGGVAPEAWRGALPVTYHVGPAPPACT